MSNVEENYGWSFKRPRRSPMLNPIVPGNPSMNIQAPHASSGNDGMGDAGGLERVGPVELSNHHYGHTYHTTNTNTFHGPGPAYFINHVENAMFGANTDLLVLDSLLPKHPPITASRNTYLPYSRSGDERAIWAWIRNPAGSLVFWIHGAAGLGKSTLAQHIQQQLRSQGKLAAAIFLSAFRPNLPIPETVIQLIAGELGRIHSQAIPAILRAYRLCHATPAQTLMEKLVLDSVRSLELQHPLVVVLDATDEWSLHGAFMEALPCLDSSLVRFLIFGRLKPQGKQYRNLDVQLHPLLQVSNEVMEGYFDWRLGRAEWESGTKPSSYDVAKLAEKADGLFIWAETACSLLEDKLSLSSTRDALASILHPSRGLSEDDGLAYLYRNAISLLFPKPADQNIAITFLSAAMVLQEPLPIHAFSTLVGMRESVIREAQTRLKSLQIRQPLDADTRTAVHPAGSVFHLSFIEFFEVVLGRQNPGLPTPTFAMHKTFARACIRELVRLPRAAQEPHSHSPLRLYIVKYLALHLSSGAPEAQPFRGAASAWEASELRSAIQEAPISALYQWCALLVQLVQPGSEMQMEPCSEADSEKGRLMLDVARCLTAATNLQLFQIPCLRIAVLLLPDDPRAWSALGNAYYNLAEHSLVNDAVQQAIAAYRNTLSVVAKSGGHGLGHALNSLALARFTSWGRSGEVESLNAAIELNAEALSLHPRGHPDRPVSLNNLALCLLSRFNTGGSDDDLRKATELHREVLSLFPHGHSTRSNSLNNLAICLRSRYAVGGSAGDIREATELNREALSLCPPGHPKRSSSLNNLAICLLSQYETGGSEDDIKEATELNREALSLRPHGHPRRSNSLNNLANCLQSQYETAGYEDVLMEAIELNREALLLRPRGHPEHPKSLNNLGRCLQSVYEEGGAIDVLQEATELHREALLLHPQGHPGRSISLDNLGFCLQIRCETEGCNDALREAIELHSEAVSLRPHGHPHRSWGLDNLANCLLSRYELGGSDDDLGKAVELHTEALSLRPRGHTGHPGSLNNLATCLQSRYKAGGYNGDLQDAIKLRREAILLMAHSHPKRSSTLNQLADGLQLRAETELGSADDLEEAITLNREALSIMHSGHPNRTKALTSLAACLQCQYKNTGAGCDLREAINLYNESLRLLPPCHRLSRSVLEKLSSALRLAGAPDDLIEAESLRKTRSLDRL